MSFATTVAPSFLEGMNIKMIAVRVSLDFVDDMIQVSIDQSPSLA